MTKTKSNIILFLKAMMLGSCFLFCLPINSYSQEAFHYTTKDGLPSDHVYDVCQDVDGFMWFATNRGVAKYDGSKFRVFTIADGLPNNDVYALNADSKGRVWYQSKSQYQGYFLNDSVYKFIVQDSLVLSSTTVDIGNNRIWFNGYTLSKGMFISGYAIDYLALNEAVREATQQYEIELESFSFFFNPSEKQHIIANKDMLLFLDSNYRLLNKQFLEADLFHLKGNNKAQKNSVLNTREYGLLPNQCYFVTHDQGVLFINLRSFKVTNRSFKELVGVENVSQVYCSVLPNEVQIGLVNHILRFNYDFDLVETILVPQHKSSNFVYYDRDGHTWRTSLGDGVYFIPQANRTRSLYLTSKAVKKIGVIDTTLIAGVKGDGFYARHDNQFRKEIALDAMEDIYQIKSNPDNKEGRLLSNTRILNRRDNKYSEIILEPVIVNNQKTIPAGFKDILEYDKDLFVISGSNFLVFDEHGKVNKFRQSKQGMLAVGLLGHTVYIGGSDGLFAYENNSLVSLQEKGALLGLPITAIENSSTHLIVATDGMGIYLYNQNEIIPIPSTSGLIVQKILVEGDSTLWLATQQGVQKIILNKNNLEKSFIVDAFYQSDGLLQDNTNDIAIQDSFLYAASDRGLVRINLNNPIYTKAPRLYFRHASDTVVFDGINRNNISIFFGAIDFTNAEYLSYEYRLLPAENRWTNTEAKVLNFSELSPDFYTLEVRATDQHKNFTVKRIYLKIVPRWWQTTAVKIVFGILLLILFLLFIKFIQARIRKTETEKANKKKQLVDLELQALRSQMNPHFVHNSLNAIQYYIQGNNIKRSEEYLVKFSKLVRLFFEYSRKQSITISSEISLLTKYLDIEQLRFEDKMSYSIMMDEGIDAEERIIPSMILQPIVENAVNHGLFHKKNAGYVHVSFESLSENAFKVSIIDNGIGMAQASEIFKNSAKNYQSRSSSVLEKRLALLKDSKEWDISYKIEDLNDHEEDTGTRITLVFDQILDI